MNWSVAQVNRNVHDVEIDLTKTGEDFWVLLSSDRHHDNAHADHALERKHLDMVLEREAAWIDIGDMHCAMQGKFDKRASTDACRPEQQNGRYLDSLVECASEFYAPYAKNAVVIGRGNHETAILKRHETDLTERTCQAMSAISEHPVPAGGYGGWVRFLFKKTKTQRQQVNLKYFHGSGGGGPVTRGVIQTNRMSVYLPDAQIVATGHTHDQWIVPIGRERIDRAGVVHMDEQTHVRCGTYKDEYGDGFGGWHIERGGPPKTVGAMWLHFRREGNDLIWDFHRTT